jgi:uncharacterized protein (DUF2249 family)
MSKDLWEQQRETEIHVEMNEFTFMQIPPQLRQEMEMKRIEQPSWKDVYKSDETWQELNKNFIEALKARKQREDEIRAGL